MLSLLLVACSPQQVSVGPQLGLLQSNELRVGTALTAPFVSRDTNGELVGFDVDLMREIAQGLNLEWRELAFADLLPQLHAGQLDAVIAALYITEERRAQVDFSQGYLDTGLALIVNSADAEDYANPDLPNDLAGLRLGVKERSTGLRYAEALLNQGMRLQLQVYVETSDSLDDLRAGRLDGVLNDRLNSLYDNRQRGGTFVVPYILEEATLGIAVRKDHPELLDYLNQAIDALKANGTIDRLYKQWIAPQTP